MIRVTDVTGIVHEFSDGEFHTEEIGNNLVVDSPTSFAVFADGQWVKAEKVSRG